MSRAFSLAGFQVTLIGRFWVTPEAVVLRNVWSAAELQAKKEEWQLVCANVSGL